MQTIDVTVAKTGSTGTIFIEMIFGVLNINNECAIMGPGGVNVIVKETKQEVLEKIEKAKGSNSNE